MSLAIDRKIDAGSNDPLEHLFALHTAIQTAVRQGVLEQSTAMLSRTVRDDEGDTIFGIDRVAEDVLLPYCEAWGREQSFRLVAEGLEPEGRRFGSGAPEFRVIVDPVDGSRGLMHDKRSAWCLSAIAEEHGDATRLRHVFAALQTELPTTRHGYVDQLWATRDTGTQQRRTCLFDGSTRALSVAPSSSTTLHHGFATVCDFFPGGKEILGRLAERILQAEMGGWNPEKAEIFADQYISSGGQLAEIVLGRDRFVLDVRPLVYASLGVVSSLCARPYDICTALIAQQAGVVVTDPFGEVLDPPLDVSTNVAFAAYANPGLAARLQPLVTEALRTLL